jgi:hypothetical protein
MWEMELLYLVVNADLQKRAEILFVSFIHVVLLSALHKKQCTRNTNPWKHGKDMYQNAVNIKKTCTLPWIIITSYYYYYYYYYYHKQLLCP